MWTTVPAVRSSSQKTSELGPSRDYDSRFATLGTDAHRFSEDSQRGGLVEFWGILRAEYRIVLGAMAAGLVLALLVALLRPPAYSAKCELVIESPNSNFLGTEAVSPVAIDPAEVSGLTDVQTQLRVIQSDQLIDRVIAKIQAEGKLGSLESQATKRSFLALLLHRPPLSANERAYRIHLAALNHLTVRQVGPTRAVDISYSSNDPAFAALFCNTMASEYIAYNMEARWALSERTGDGLSHRLDAVRAQLNQSQKNLQDYAARSGLLFGPPIPGTGESADVSQSRLTELQSELSKAEDDRIAAESRMKTAESAGPNSVAEVVNDDSLRDLQSKITDLQRQKADLLTVYTPEHEKVQRVQAQLTPLQEAFARHLAQIRGRIRNDYGAALRREDMLRSAYNQQVVSVTDKNGKAIQYGILKHQVDSDEKLYESILEQVNRVSIATAAGSSNVQVFSNARPPVRPQSSGVVMYPLGGLFFGFLAGSTFVFLRSISNRTFQSPGQSEVQVQLRELGIIPNQGSSLNRSFYRLALSSESDTGEKTRISVNPRDKHSVELAGFLDEKGMVAESFRMLLASIMFTNRQEKGPQIIVLSSANPKEGKTTVLCNLAIAMAEIRRRVLVIDADLRKPRLHEIFEASNEHGLRDILEPSALSDTELATAGRLIQPTLVAGVDVLPSGVGEGKAEASLFYSSRFPELLQRLRKQYDVVLIDTPPCLHLADARVIGQFADAVILVTRAGRTTWTEGRAVAQKFASDGTRIMGTVLNDFKQSVSSYSQISG